MLQPMHVIYELRVVFLLFASYKTIFLHHIIISKYFRAAASDYLRRAGEVHGTVKIQISIGESVNFCNCIIVSLDRFGCSILESRSSYNFLIIIKISQFSHFEFQFFYVVLVPYTSSVLVCLIRV